MSDTDETVQPKWDIPYHVKAGDPNATPIDPNATSEFHSIEQLFFSRLEGGRVRVRKGVAATILEPESWASAVGHVSARGSCGSAYQDALEVHQLPNAPVGLNGSFGTGLRPGERNVVLACLSDDIERIKACRS